MKILIFILIGVIFILLLYILSLNKQIKKVTTDLKRHTDEQTKKKITIQLLNRDLEQLAEQINQQIENSQRALVQKQQSQDELKSIIANISHDIRTPLTSIGGYVQMLQQANLSPEKQERYLEVIDRRLQDVQMLLNDFFLLSVIESKGYEVKLEPILLTECLYETFGHFHKIFESHNLTPQIEIQDEKALIIGDAGAMKRVLENLMINLVKHSSGDIKIKLETVDNYVKLSVIDYAPKLTKDQVSKLFQKFYTGDESRTKNNTGLGLTIVSELMAKMGGTVLAHKQENNLVIECYFKRAT